MTADGDVEQRAAPPDGKMVTSYGGRPSRQALSEEVASYVRALIMSGELREGDFVRLDRIAAEMDISVTPVREGLLLLRGEGFVVLEPRRGFMVAPLSPDDVADLFFVQASIAGELAARAAKVVSDADVEHLDTVQQAISAAVGRGDSDQVVRLNHQLHRSVNRAAMSPKLTWFLSLAVRYVPSRFFASIEGWEEASAHDHAALISALRARDSAAARSAMEEHIRHAGELLVSHLVRVGATAPAASQHGPGGSSSSRIARQPGRRPSGRDPRPD